MDFWILTIPLLIVSIFYADQYYRETFEPKAKKPQPDEYIKKSALLPCTVAHPVQDKNLKKDVLDLPHAQLAADWETYTKGFEVEPTLPNYRAFGHGLV